MAKFDKNKLAAGKGKNAVKSLKSKRTNSFTPGQGKNIPKSFKSKRTVNSAAEPFKPKKIIGLKNDGGDKSTKKTWKQGPNKFNVGNRSFSKKTFNVKGSGKPKGINMNSSDAMSQRDVRKERQSQRPNNDIVVLCKEIWNKLRERSLPESKRLSLMSDLMKLIHGKVYDISMKHDSSRVIQCALTFGSEIDRSSIIGELESHLVELSQLQYAHFIVIKLLKKAKNPNEQKIIVKNFRGHVVQLATHGIGARVIQKAMDSLPSGKAAQLRVEFYGPENIFFASMTSEKFPKNLSQVLSLRPDRRDAVLEGVKKFLLKIAQKSLLSFPFTHSLLWEYIRECGQETMIAELVPNLLDGFMALLSTRDGSRVAAKCAAYGNAKDRKRMMKAMKGYVCTSLMHRDAYLAVLRLVASVDDTVSCQKALLVELLQPLPTINKPADSDIKKLKEGETADQWVPRGLAKSSGTGEMDSEFSMKDEELNTDFEEDDMDVEENELSLDGEDSDDSEDAEHINGLTEDMDTLSADPASLDTALLSVCLHLNGCKLILYLLANDHSKYFDPEERELMEPAMIPDSEGNMICTSKKDDTVRKSELVAYLREPLINLCKSNSPILIRSKFAGAKVLLETMKRFPDAELIEAVANEAVSVPTDSSLPPYEDASAHLFMKHLLNWEASEQQKEMASSIEESNSFAHALMERLGKDGLLKKWIKNNRGAFVIAALLAVPSVSRKLKQMLKGFVPDPATGKGGEVLMEALNNMKSGLS